MLRAFSSNMKFPWHIIKLGMTSAPPGVASLGLASSNQLSQVEEDDLKTRSTKRIKDFTSS